MFRKLVIGALGAMAVLFSTTAFAQGTAADAKAMLERTVAAIKADKPKTLDQINKGENGFLVGDLYPFCFDLSDGLLVARRVLKCPRILAEQPIPTSRGAVPCANAAVENKAAMAPSAPITSLRNMDIPPCSSSNLQLSCTCAGRQGII